MKITFSIVTYNSINDISKILDSIFHCDSIDINVTIIDNNSDDKTVDYLRKNYPMVKIIELNKNYGYGYANNIAIMNANSDYHIVANPDVYFDEDNLFKMISFMENHKDVALLTPKVMNVNGTEQFLPKKYPILRYAISSRFEKYFKVFSNLRDDYTLKNKNITEFIDIDYATGCFMFFRTNSLKSINGFDTRYFLYSEDADITLKIKTVGRSVYVPNISITHIWKRESMKKINLFLIQISSLLKFYCKWGFRL